MSEQEAEEKAVVTACTDCGNDIHCTTDCMLYQCGCVSKNQSLVVVKEEKEVSRDIDDTKITEDITFSADMHKKIDVYGEARRVAGKVITMFALWGFFDEAKIARFFETHNKGSGDQIIFGYQLNQVKGTGAANRDSGNSENYFEKSGKKFLTPCKIEFADGKEMVIIAFKHVSYGSRLFPIIVESLDDEASLSVCKFKLSTVIEKEGYGTVKKISTNFEDTEKEKLQDLIISHFKINVRNPEIGKY